MYDNNRFDEALQSCDAAFDADACRVDNLLLLSAIHFELKSYEASAFYCQQCIEVNPNSAEAYSNLGNAMIELGDTQGAIQNYLKVSLSFCLFLLILLLISSTSYLLYCRRQS